MNAKENGGSGGEGGSGGKGESVMRVCDGEEGESGHSAGARLYHNNTNWQLSYRLIGYPNGPNGCTHYDIICGTNAIMKFKGKWWAQ